MVGCKINILKLIVFINTNSHLEEIMKEKSLFTIEAKKIKCLEINSINIK